MDNPEPFDDVLVDTANLTVADLAGLFAGREAAPIHVVAGPSYETAEGRIDAVMPEVPAPVVAEQGEAEPPSEVEPVEGETIEEAEWKRYRMRPRSADEDKVFDTMVKPDFRNMTYRQVEAELAAKGKIAPVEAPSPAAPVAAAPVAAAPVAESGDGPDRVTALHNEMKGILEELKETDSYDLEAWKAINVRKMECELALETAKEERIKNLAQSPAAKAPDPEQTAKEAAANQVFEAIVAQDENDTWTKYKGLELGESGPLAPMYREMRNMLAKLEAENDPAVYSPRITSILADAAAAKLNVRPTAETPARVTAPVPGPAAAAPRQAASAPRPVVFDAEAIAFGLNTFTLQEALSR